ncbi:MAG: transcription antitermination factor NusB [Myxococcales bacterium]|nr:transcription antitermination factor NusB [Myxococcales bacterium]
MAIFWENPPGEGQEEAPPIAAWSAKEATREFAERLVAAVRERGGAIDATIEATSRSWRVARMDRVDRNILRLAVAELEAVPETPRAVILAEAVRLAARYGGERSAPFVNGLAESLARRLRPDEARA